MGGHADAGLTKRLAAALAALAPGRRRAQQALQRGLVLRTQGRHAEAAAAFEAAVALAPADPEPRYRLANSLNALGRLTDALRRYDEAIALDPAHNDAHYNRGLVLQALMRPAEALASYEHALALRPGDAEALNNRGNALMQLRRHHDALDSYRQALAADPALTHARFNVAVALLELKRPDGAVAALEELLRAAPDYPRALGKLLHARMLACDWRDFEALRERVFAALRAGPPEIDPFGLQAVCDDPTLLRTCAAAATASDHPPVVGGSRPPRPSRGAGDPIRIGYVSGEFRQQATAVLAAELFELHDRERFEVWAFDNGWDDGSAMRRRLDAAFGNRRVDIARLDDDGAAAAVADRGIDILVDLNGFFGLARQGVFARRPAPVQVNYLGFPGTLGAAYMDYLIADPRVVPMDQQPHFVERIVHLPDSYQPNDRRRAIAATVPPRAELGLPAEGFVFCCFNNNYKITPAVFALWTRLLLAVPASVLWLLQDNEAASVQLRRAAQAAGIEPGRLVFAPRIALDAHLARMRRADLFLDTSPSNAHTTASDALWTGLPVLTMRGRGFSARVAASLLHAAGLPELVAESADGYLALGLELARDPQRLAVLRARLAAERERCALFDTPRYCHHLEAAYATMADRARRGEPPQAFAVTPLP